MPCSKSRAFPVKFLLKPESTEVLGEMRGMCWFPLMLLLSSTIFNNLSEGSHSHKLHSAVVVGTVYCDTCFQQDFSKPTHAISGASVAVECRNGSSSSSSRPSFRQEVKTNGLGEFKVHLPFSVTKHVKKIKRCSVKLISSSEPYCAVAATATSSSLHLKSRKQGIHIFSAGFFTFKPFKQPNLCNQKPSVQETKQINNQNSLGLGQRNSPIFPPPLQYPETPEPSPLLPFLPPLPQLPPLPPLPGLPIPPIPGRS